jgi:hypothetical protein
MLFFPVSTLNVTLFCLLGRALERGRELLGKRDYKRVDELHGVYFLSRHLL